MKKIFVKIIVIFIITILINITYINQQVYANEIKTLDDVISAAEDFKTAGEGTKINDTNLKDTSKTIYNILFTIAVVLAFAVGIVIGIQFIVGSADEKAKIKETLVPYAVGVFVVFGSFAIWRIIVRIGNSL